MFTFTFYVGSSAEHAAHDDMALVLATLTPATPCHVATLATYGEWEGVRERVTLYSVALPDDAAAQRIAYALTRLTGNDAILITRPAVRMPAIDPAPQCYRAELHSVDRGNRTLTPSYSASGEGPDYGVWGEQLTRHLYGRTIAYMVWSDNRVTPLEG